MNDKKQINHHHEMHHRAKELRQTQTPAEEKLWHVLRRKNLNRHKFRRQHPIGPFIVDFYCNDANLIIELDGEIHNFQEEQDTARTQWLEERGYRVLRFTNQQVDMNIHTVIKEILSNL